MLAIIGWLFCAFILGTITLPLLILQIVNGNTGEHGFRLGEYNKTERITSFIFLVICFYLWYLLISISPFDISVNLK